jgi:hypothetical protein
MLYATDYCTNYFTANDSNAYGDTDKRHTTTSDTNSLSTTVDG